MGILGLGEYAPMNDDHLLPCPFCGTAPTIERWHGGSPTKVMIHCDNEDCNVGPNVTGETKEEALSHWNKRVKSPQRIFSPTM